MSKLAIVGAFLLISVANCLGRASFGEACGDGIRCDSRAFLTCINSTCDCKMGEMTYDEERRKCVVLSGERCSYPLKLEQAKKSTEKQNCIKNAKCDEGTCKCNRDYFENSERFCVLRKGLGESCMNNKQCQSKLHCINEACGCKDGVGIVHDPVKGGCVLQEGQLCRSGKERVGTCVSNAACNSSLDSGHDRKGYCTCNSGYHRNTSGFCLAKNNHSCSYHSECVNNLVCVERKCSCPFPSHQSYSENGCVGDIGSPCNLLVDGQIKEYPCIPNAHCNISIATSECECDDGLVEVEGKCEVAYGQVCSKSAKCDSVAGLVCINEVCGCPFLQEYDEKKRKCRGLVGASCKAGEFCIDGATCNLDEHRRGNSSKSVGVCRCKKGMDLSHEGKCVRVNTTKLKLAITIPGNETGKTVQTLKPATTATFGNGTDATAQATFQSTTIIPGNGTDLTAQTTLKSVITTIPGNGTETTAQTILQSASTTISESGTTEVTDSFL